MHRSTVEGRSFPSAAVSKATERMIAALADPDAVFTRDQVAYLMSTTARWAREAVEEEPSELTYRAGFEAGYRDRCSEENDDFRKQNETLYFNAGEHTTALERKKLRDRFDATALVPRAHDHVGGPVSWDTGRTSTLALVRPTPASLPADESTTATASTLMGSAA